MIGSIAVAAAEDGSDDDTEDPMPVPIGQSLARGLPVSRRPSKIRLKCHYNQDIRAVAISEKTSFPALRQRLREDYGFEVALKYQDSDGDLIVLDTQNDLDELLQHELNDRGTVNARVVVQRLNSTDGGNVDGSTCHDSSGSGVDNCRSSSSISPNCQRYGGMLSGGHEIGNSAGVPNFKDQSGHARRMSLGSSGGIGLERLVLGTSGGALNHNVGARAAADIDLKGAPSNSPLLLPVTSIDGDRNADTSNNSIDGLGASYARALKPSLQPLHARPTTASKTEADVSGSSQKGAPGGIVPANSTPGIRAPSENSLRPLQPFPSSKLEATSRTSPERALNDESQSRPSSKSHLSAIATAGNASTGTATGVPAGIRWRRGEVLGQGAFGLVCLGLNADTGELMAVKELAYPPKADHDSSTSGTSGETFTGSDSDDHKRITNAGGERGWASAVTVEHEVCVLRELNHPNIVRYLGTQRSNGSNSTGTVCIFMEYVPGGSIRQLLDRFGAFDEQVVRAYSRQILAGLEYLHANGIAHRDVKGANVLIAADGIAKLADFGAAKRIPTLQSAGLSENGNADVVIAPGNASDVNKGPSSSNGVGTTVGSKEDQNNKVRGTPLWMAPEVLRESTAAWGWRQADVWSFACTVVEMGSAKPPWYQYSNPLAAMYHIACCEDEAPLVPEPFGEVARDLLKQCFQRDSSMRPDVSALRQHAFVLPVADASERYDIRDSSIKNAPPTVDISITSDEAIRNSENTTNEVAKDILLGSASLLPLPVVPIGLVEGTERDFLPLPSADRSQSKRVSDQGDESGSPYVSSSSADVGNGGEEDGSPLAAYSYHPPHRTYNGDEPISSGQPRSNDTTSSNEGGGNPAWRQHQQEQQQQQQYSIQLSSEQNSCLPSAPDAANPRSDQDSLPDSSNLAKDAQVYPPPSYSPTSLRPSSTAPPPAPPGSAAGDATRPRYSNINSVDTGSKVITDCSNSVHSSEVTSNKGKLCRNTNTATASTLAPLPGYAASTLRSRERSASYADDDSIERGYSASRRSSSSSVNGAGDRGSTSSTDSSAHNYPNSLSAAAVAPLPAHLSGQPYLPQTMPLQAQAQPFAHATPPRRSSVQRTRSDPRNSRGNSSHNSRSNDLLRRASPTPLQPLQSPLLTGCSPPQTDPEPSSPLHLSAVAPLENMPRDSSGTSDDDFIVGGVSALHTRSPLLQPLHPMAEQPNASDTEQQPFGEREPNREWSRPKNLSFDSNGSDASGFILAEPTNGPLSAKMPLERRLDEPLKDFSDDAWSDSDESDMVEAGGEGDSPMHRSAGSRSRRNEEIRRSSESSTFDSEDASEVRNEAPLDKTLVRNEDDQFNGSKGVATVDTESMMPPSRGDLSPRSPGVLDSDASRGNGGFHDQSFDNRLVDNRGITDSGGHNIDNSPFADGCDVYEEEYDAVDVDTHAAAAAALNSRNGLRDAAFRRNSRHGSHLVADNRYNSHLPVSIPNNERQRRNHTPDRSHISGVGHSSRSNNRSNVAPMDLPQQRLRGSVSDRPDMELSPPHNSTRPQPPPVILPPSSPTLSTGGNSGPSSPYLAMSGAASPVRRRGNSGHGTTFFEGTSSSNHNGSNSDSRFTFDDIASSGVTSTNAPTSSATSPGSPSERPRRSLGTTRLAMREARTAAAVDGNSFHPPSLEVGVPPSLEASTPNSPTNFRLQDVGNGQGRRRCGLQNTPNEALPSPASPARSSTGEWEDSRDGRWNRWHHYGRDGNESDEREGALVGDAQNASRNTAVLSHGTYPFDAAARAEDVDYDEEDAAIWNEPEAVLALPGALSVTCLSLLLYPHSSRAPSVGVSNNHGDGNGAGKCLLLAAADADGMVRMFRPRPDGSSHNNSNNNQYSRCSWRCVASLPHELLPNTSSSPSSSNSSNGGDALLPHPLSPAARVRESTGGSSGRRLVGSVTPESPPEFRRSRTVPLGRSPSSHSIDGHSSSSRADRSLGGSNGSSSNSATSAATAARGYSAVTAMQVASTGAVVSGADDGTVRVWDLSKVSTGSGGCNGVDGGGGSTGGGNLSGGSTGGGITANSSNSSASESSSSRHDHSPTAVFRGHVGKITKIVLETAGPGRGLGGGGGGSSGGGSSGGDWTGRFVTAGADHSVRLWDVRARRPMVFKFSGHTDTVTALLLDSDKSAVVSGSKDSSLRAWDLRTGRARLVSTQHFGGVQCLALDASADGGRGAYYSGARDATVQVWARNGQCLRTLRSARGMVQAIAVRAREGLASRSSASSSSSSSASRPSGGKSAPELESRVATAHSDGTLRVWDPHRGRCVRELRPHDSAMAATATASSSSFDSNADEGFGEGLGGGGGGNRRSASSFTSTPPRSSPHSNYQQQQQSPSSSHRHRSSATAADTRGSSSNSGGGSGNSWGNALAATCVTWGPAPGSALVGYADGAVRVWNARSGAQEATWPGLQGIPPSGGVSRSGNIGDGSVSGAVSTLICDAERAFIGDRHGCVRIFALAPHLRGIS